MLCRGRVLRPLPCPARRLGSISERRLSKPSAVTTPAATSSQSAVSISAFSFPVPRTISAKKDGPDRPWGQFNCRAYILLVLCHLRLASRRMARNCAVAGQQLLRRSAARGLQPCCSRFLRSRLWKSHRRPAAESLDQSREATLQQKECSALKRGIDSNSTRGYCCPVDGRKGWLK